MSHIHEGRIQRGMWANARQYQYKLAPISKNGEIDSLDFPLPRLPITNFRLSVCNPDVPTIVGQGECGRLLQPSG